MLTTGSSRLAVNQGQQTVPFHNPYVKYSFLLCNSNLSLRRAIFTIFDFKNAVTLKTGLGVRQGHWKCHHVIEHTWLSIDVL